MKTKRLSGEGEKIKKINVEFVTKEMDRYSKSMNTDLTKAGASLAVGIRINLDKINEIIDYLNNHD